MKLELRENMYVRTNLGKIGKIKVIKPFYIKIEIKKNVCFTFEVEDIVKASYNIIDILEKGDYVNGHRIEEIDFDDEEIFTDSEYYCGVVEFCNIKSVITHEQMEQMAYKV